VAVLNLFTRLRGDAFRSFVHPTAAVESVVAANGLRRIVHHEGLIWQVVVFAR